MSNRRDRIDYAQKQVLGESALNANKERHTHDDIPVSREVQDLIDRNNLESATILFSRGAIELFSQMFGTSMEMVVERALSLQLERLERVIHKTVEAQLTNVLINATSVFTEFLPKTVTTDTKIETVVDKVVEKNTMSRVDQVTNVVDMIIPRGASTKKNTQAHNRSDRLKKNGKPPVDDRTVLGNSRAALSDNAPHLLSVFKATPNVPVKLSDACKIVKEKYGYEWANPNHTITYLQKQGHKLIREKMGFYILIEKSETTSAVTD